MKDFSIEKYQFEPKDIVGKKNKDCEPIPSLKKTLLGTNWPVVYILYSDNPAVKDRVLYVGESTSASQRMSTHVDDKQRNVFNAVRIIFDTKFNKSAILDVEQSLINLFFADKVYTLQNRNEGQSDSHDYYDRSYYQGKVREIWQDLKLNSDITINNDYNSIINSKLFKFSPYTVLTEEQNDVCVNVLEGVFNVLDNWKTNPQQYVAQIDGKAGTGKTIVLMHMFGILESPRPMSSGKNSINGSTKFNNLIGKISNYKKSNGLKFAYVCSYGSLYNTMKDVVSGTFGRRVKGTGKVLKPVDIGKSLTPFDVVFVDESHRLFGRSVGMGTKAFGKTNKDLFGAQSDTIGRYTQLDWILKNAKCVVMVYDKNQAVRVADMEPIDFNNAFNRVGVVPSTFQLLGQMRCNGGAIFMDFLDKMLSTKSTSAVLKCPDVGSYDIKLFENAPALIDAIARNDASYGLCRTICGPGEQYNQGKYTDAIKEYKKNNSLSDGQIYYVQATRQLLINHLCSTLGLKDGILEYVDVYGTRKRYIRNLNEWVLNGNPYEIGCIHTVQGYDLNFVGVIFSEEIHYDHNKKKVYVDQKKIKDHNSVPRRLKAVDAEQFVLNTYKVILSRGVQGCYMYAVNEDMQKYLASLDITYVHE